MRKLQLIPSTSDVNLHSPKLKIIQILFLYTVADISVPASASADSQYMHTSIQTQL